MCLNNIIDLIYASNHCFFCDPSLSAKATQKSTKPAKILAQTNARLCSLTVWLEVMLNAVQEWVQDAAESVLTPLGSFCSCKIERGVHFDSTRFPAQEFKHRSSVQIWKHF